MGGDGPSNRWTTAVATGFGVGRLPKAPGTWGSLAACLTAWPIAAAYGPAALWIASGLAFLIGLWACRLCLKQADPTDPRSADPPFIIIDEVAGQWLTLAVAPLDPVYYGLGFLLFRAFDIIKPPPVAQAEKLPGPLGVMADDMVAGAMAAAILWGLVHWATG